MAKSLNCLRVRRLVSAVLLLLVPACGPSEYEERMIETQQHEQRFREEQKLLGEPVQMATRKDKSSHEGPVADLFFRPPAGIQPAPEPKPRADLLWRYPGKPGGDFEMVELAFATDDNELAAHVLKNYVANARADDRPREILPPGRETPLIFDVWEFDNGSQGYTVNVLRASVPQVAVVFVYKKERREAARKAMELSLGSLAVGSEEAEAARLKYERKSPWHLRGTATP